MLEIVEKTLLTGIGAMALTQRKAEELIDDLKKNLEKKDCKKNNELIHLYSSQNSFQILG